MPSLWVPSASTWRLSSLFQAWRGNMCTWRSTLSGSIRTMDWSLPLDWPCSSVPSVLQEWTPRGSMCAWMSTSSGCSPKIGLRIASSRIRLAAWWSTASCRSTASFSGCATNSVMTLSALCAAFFDLNVPLYQIICALSMQCKTGLQGIQTLLVLNSLQICTFGLIHSTFQAPCVLCNTSSS